MHKHFFSLLFTVLLLQVLTSPSCSQKDSLLKPESDAHSSSQLDKTQARRVPIFFYYALAQHYPLCEFFAIIGEIRHHRHGTEPYKRYLVPYDYNEWEGSTYERQAKGITNVDSLGQVTCTEYFTAYKGDSVSLFFTSSVGTMVDTSTGWYQFSDTLKVYVDVVDSATSRIIQTLDSTVILPSQHTNEAIGQELRHNDDRARVNPEKVPLFYTYPLNVPDNGMKVSIHIRPYFGATSPDNKANMFRYSRANAQKKSAFTISEHKRREAKSEYYKRTISSMSERHMANFDESLSKQIELVDQDIIVDSTFSLTFTSSQGRQYDILMENQEGETVYTFEPVYAFPGIEQTITCDMRSYPKGFYLVLIYSEEKLVQLTVTVVRRMGEQLFPDASPRLE